MTDKLAGTIVEYSKNRADLSQLLSYLKSNEEVLIKWGSKLDDVIEFLDAKQHSLGLMFLLACRVQSTMSDPGAFFAHCTNLVAHGAREQIMMSPARFASVMHAYADKCVDRKVPGRGIALLSAAIVKMQPNAFTLTPLHAEFVKLCILSKNYKAALKLCDQDVLDVEGCASQPRDLMLYAYYSGIVYASQKKWTEASRMFEMCICTPAMALSAIAVEAYKKYVLVNLIASGAVPMLPRHGSTIVTANVKKCAVPYVELSNAFSTHDTKEVAAVVTRHQTAFTKEHNFGLVMQAVSALSRLNVLRLTKTYMSVSLADLAKSCGLKDAKTAETVLVQMVADGQVKATINQRTGMVVFHQAEEHYDDVNMLREIDGRVQRASNILHRLQELDQRVQTSSGYLMRIVERTGADAQAGAH